MKEVLEGRKYRAVFNGERGSYEREYSDHAYSSVRTIQYMDLTVMVRDKETRESFVSRYRRQGTGWVSCPSTVREAVFPYQQERVIPERKDTLVDYLLGGLVQQIKQKDPHDIARVPLDPPSVSELVQRGFLYNDEGLAETLFPITSEDIPREQKDEDIPY